MPRRNLIKLANAVAAAAVAVAAAGGAASTVPHLPATGCNQTVQVS